MNLDRVLIGALGGLVGAGCWLGYELLVQHGRVLLRLEALEQQCAASPTGTRSASRGLPVGTVMHDFDLPTLAGGRMTLSQWRGQRVVLIFVEPGSGFSRTLLSDLAILPTDAGADPIQPLLVSRGDAQANRDLLRDAREAWPVLLQEDDELAALYRVDATPTAYLLDEQGATASEPVTGAHPILQLLRAASGGADGPSADSRLSTLPLTHSRLERDGLTAGTPAPEFRLPLVSGGEAALRDYRGRPLLLIFSDPACGPCEALAPELERLHRRHPWLHLLMISRGDLETNRLKVTEHGLTFQVALQRHWEVSRAYGMFATPIGYLIDERGVIAADVAVGADAIRALVSDWDSKLLAPSGRGR